MVAILTLALGIGANTAVYAVVHGVLLAPLPYERPERVVVLNELSPQFPNPISVSWQNYMDWRDRSALVDLWGSFTDLDAAVAGGPDRWERSVKSGASLGSIERVKEIKEQFPEVIDPSGLVVDVDLGQHRGPFLGGEF